MKLLVVDESRVMRQIISRTLRQAGFGDYAIIEATQGAEGLMKARDEDPDLILSAWRMPVMDGLDFLRALRASGSAVPFGFVTCESSQEKRGQAERAGAAFLIPKPFNADMFADAFDGLTTQLTRTTRGATPTRTGPSTHDMIYRRPHPLVPTSLPSRQVLRETFEMLLGRTVKSGDGGRVVLDMDTGPICVATIVTDNGALVATFAADLPLTVYAGACLELLPAATAQTIVAERARTEVTKEDFNEVLNVLSGVFNVEGAPHVRLGTVYYDSGSMPPEVLLNVKALTRREDVFVDIAGYGAGNLSIVLAGVD